VRMKSLLLAFFVAAVAANEWTLFNDFLIKYEKRYDSLEEFNRRFDIFKVNLDRIAEMNAAHIKAGGEAVFGVNDLADLSREEFIDTHLMKNLPYEAPNAGEDWSVSSPQSYINWQTNGYVTGVYNQGQCGSCWAFSADEAFESYYALKYGSSSLVSCSAQQCAECTYAASNPCNGGWPWYSYTNAIQNRGGLETWAAYPYNIPQLETQPCQLTNGKATNPVGTVTGYTQQPKGSLAMNLASGPPSVCVAAEAWQYYTGGVLTTCPGSVDHCVQAVGYNNNTASNAYWIVRNSWGAGWGISGYIWISMTAAGGDLCLINDYVNYPFIA